MNIPQKFINQAINQTGVNPTTYSAYPDLTQNVNNQAEQLYMNNANNMAQQAEADLNAQMQQQIQQQQMQQNNQLATNGINNILPQMLGNLQSQQNPNVLNMLASLLGG